MTWGQDTLGVLQWRPRRPFRPPGLGSSGPPRGPTPRERARPAAPRPRGGLHTARERAREGRAPRRPRARPLWRAAGRCEYAPGPCGVRPAAARPRRPASRRSARSGPSGGRASVTHRERRARPRESRLRHRRPGSPPTAASERPFGREQGGHLRAAVTSVIQTARQWRGRGRGKRRARPPRPGGRRDGRGGSAPGRARPRGAGISRVGRGSGSCFTSPDRLRFTDPRRRSRKGKILNTAHPGGFSLKRLCENALGAAAFLV